MLVGGLILLAVGVVLMLIGRNEAHRWVLYAGLVVAALGVILLVVYTIDSTGADTAMLAPLVLFSRGRARMRRLREWAWDELRALVYDWKALGRDIDHGRVSAQPRHKVTPDGRVLRVDYRNRT